MICGVVFNLFENRKQKIIKIKFALLLMLTSLKNKSNVYILRLKFHVSLYRVLVNLTTIKCEWENKVARYNKILLTLIHFHT